MVGSILSDAMDDPGCVISVSHRVIMALPTMQAVKAGEVSVDTGMADLR